MANTIFKVQRPIFPLDQTNWLIYNKSRSIQFLAPPDDKMIALMGDDLKMYVRAKVVGKRVTFGRRTGDQPW